jgi:hypothetical protein
MTWEQLIEKTGTHNVWRLQKQFKEVIRMNKLLGNTDDDDIMEEMLALNYKLIEQLEKKDDEIKSLERTNRELHSENDRFGFGW